jgi:hypothetical protein
MNTALPNPDGSITSIVKFGKDGNIIARHALANDDNPYLVYPAAPHADLRLALFKTTLKTEIVDLDDQLHPRRMIELLNAGVKKCLELSDGSIAIFGSQFHGIATAAVTRLYKDGRSQGVPTRAAKSISVVYRRSIHRSRHAVRRCAVNR